MPKQIQKEKQASKQTQAEDNAVEITERDVEEQAVLDATDELLAEIDEALQGLDAMLGVEFVQKGGE